MLVLDEKVQAKNTLKHFKKLNIKLVILSTYVRKIFQAMNLLNKSKHSIDKN